MPRRWIILVAAGAVLLAGHLIADQYDGDAARRWLYLTRMGFYLLGFTALALLLFQARRVVLAQAALVLALLTGVELISYFILGMPAIDLRGLRLPDYPADHPGVALGELPEANSVRHEFKLHNGDTLYRATYTVDHEFRRVIPAPDSSPSRHAIFFGCSVGFGQWLHDTATLAARFQALVPGTHAYTYAHPGWGMEQMLARLEYKPLAPEIKEPSGVGVYVFIWSHVRRCIGDLQTYCRWTFQHPYYRLEQGAAVRHGRFKDGRQGTSEWYELLWKSNFVRLSGLNLPWRLSEEHVRLAVAIIERSRDLYLREFPNDRFVVAWAPDWPSPEDLRMQALFLELLRAKRIALIDARIPDRMDEAHYLVQDGHPSALANDEMAHRLAFALDSLGWRR